MKCDDLGLKEKTLNKLKQSNITSITQLINMSIEDICNIKNITVKELSKIMLLKEKMIFDKTQIQKSYLPVVDRNATILEYITNGNEKNVLKVMFKLNNYSLVGNPKIFQLNLNYGIANTLYRNDIKDGNDLLNSKLIFIQNILGIGRKKYEEIIQTAKDQCVIYYNESKLSKEFIMKVVNSYIADNIELVDKKNAQIMKEILNDFIYNYAMINHLDNEEEALKIFFSEEFKSKIAESDCYQDMIKSLLINILKSTYETLNINDIMFYIKNIYLKHPY